ncbi:hypothetical protein [Acuticoccus mangrovi]|uniref:Uncharacterized protein n=1 Tax=Acuticoccus mangrovi TaxID=2796142 RepID=A0A934IP31_9HYPH|nr:hypothetical protein [Acuticoccus mangrovi]MBJ3775943.1 hypothetical protein [Acuticoccus mangrovi]
MTRTVTAATCLSVLALGAVTAALPEPEEGTAPTASPMSSPASAPMSAPMSSPVAATPEAAAEAAPSPDRRRSPSEVHRP